MKACSSQPLGPSSAPRPLSSDDVKRVMASGFAQADQASRDLTRLVEHEAALTRGTNDLPLAPAVYPRAGIPNAMPCQSGAIYWEFGDIGIFLKFWAGNGLTGSREGFKKVPGGRRIHSG